MFAQMVVSGTFPKKKEKEQKFDGKIDAGREDLPFAHDGSCTILLLTKRQYALKLSSSCVLYLSTI